MENDENADEDNMESTPKKIKTEWSKSYSSKAFEMMRKMGYQDDKGLGKLNQGITEPIIAVQQDGRRGLGLKKSDNTTNLGEIWDTEIENITLPEKVTWLSNKSEWSYSIEAMNKWIQMAPKKLSLDDEHQFCDPDILTEILESKTVFDELDDHELRRARSRCNPFETLRSSIFINRAAVKMANIDSMCDYMFTNPKNQLGNPLIGEDDLLYFADICAGPGGFSEYVLFRKSWEAKGFGLTLRGPNDFKLEKFFAGPPESFDPYYGIKDDGNIFDESNQDSFADYIFRHCNEGVHFVMADGGFSVEGQENIQEILSKQLYLCQCLTTLKILRTNGSMVCKFFDLFTPFSVGLIYLMYKSFECISIIKPNSSRPANSERYLVCKWKKINTDTICSYMNSINGLLNNNDNDLDIMEIVDSNVMLEDHDFISYITHSNNIIGKNQIIGLKKISTFCQNPQLKEPRQSEFRTRCLKLWNLPDKLRQAPEVKTTEKYLEEILTDWYEDKKLFSLPPIELKNTESLKTNIESIYDWYFVPIGRGETSMNVCNIYLCKAKGNLLKYIGNNKWETIDQLFEISPKSLFYGELVYEYCGEGQRQTRVCGLHIIDAIMLGGTDIRRFKLSKRIKMCQKYSISLNKPFKEGKNNPIRSKPLYKLQELSLFFSQMRHYTLKDNKSRLGFSLNSDEKFFIPGGILIFCEICHNFFSKMSKSRGMLYYFHKTTNQSYYKNGMPNKIQSMLYGSFRNSFSRRLLWKWTNPQQVEKESIDKESNLLYRDEFEHFLNS